MNRISSSDQTCQLSLKQQSKVQCPFKPKIPYDFQNTFFQAFGQVSYLRKQSQDRLKNNNLKIDNNDKQCCEKFEQISQYYESTLQSQIATMIQLNELIDQHTNLLESYLKKQKAHVDQQKSPFVFSEQKDSTQQWKQKWEQENMLNHQRDQKINELKNKIEGLKEVLVKTDSYTITLELESWKNKYENLVNIHKETAEKLKGLEDELKQMNQTMPIDESLQSKKTTVTTNRRRLTKKVEN
ncbi:unnamed protein product (macronuclear) [Paramecium tetraurelia]|uniref:Uncharacterized protein n=1 Tax=Paramecium tetraurelia TaxID=5888 RepID=A0BRU4_PARTE|nr:uncharacterized protein GSPATT00031492001 [Paramecium tetraurelia]CAK61261.1 unnamed protein product [Paramecium tetraurelia]|eukprot:XP_001428659.1 hypothetical protein (macronuclear) [Paramecium tetraurelia strain d4-2]